MATIAARVIFAYPSPPWFLAPILAGRARLHRFHDLGRQQTAGDRDPEEGASDRLRVVPTSLPPRVAGQTEGIMHSIPCAEHTIAKDMLTKMLLARQRRADPV